MKNCWTVKHSGKLDILIFSFVTILLTYAFYIYKIYGSKDEDLFLSFIVLPLILLPVTIAVIWTPFSMLRRKRRVKSLIIEEESKNIGFTFFNNRMTYKLEFDKIAFQKIERKYFTILVVYEKKVATRGHVLYFQLLSLFALVISTSWKKNQILEIAERLKGLNVEEHEPKKPLTIIDYIYK
jgi:hypothetical protein